MNIHEHQAKAILRKFGAPVPNGVVILNLKEISEKVKKLNTKELILKAQIHAGGRGKAGGIKLIKNKNELIKETKEMFGKILVTPQTGLVGKKVTRLYLEETCNIIKEFYLSCLIDRSSAKITFISSASGGVNIEEVAKKEPKKITKIKLSSYNTLDEKSIKKILEPFNFSKKNQKQGFDLVYALYKILIEKDANLIEINPLVLTKDEKLLCLDAKINFDDNALYRQPDIISLRDFNEQDPIETEADKYNLSYIKLDGKIGCMVNGAGLAMATMDIIKLYGSKPANFLDVGGGASKEKVSTALKIILSDKNVKGILINIFGGIMRCDVLAKGVIEAAKKFNLSVPLVVRLAGTNVELGKEIFKKSKLKIISANNLEDAAKKIVEAIK